MSTPNTRARRLRGALVGACSALVTAAAHAAAGGELPGGAPLMLLVIISTTVGAMVSLVSVQHRHAQVATLVAALGVAQFLGHVTLALAAHHGHGLAHGISMTTPMLALHATAAVCLGLLIALAEYLYLVCASVLCWLRLIFVDRRTPVGRQLRLDTISVVAQSVLLCTGLGMRAPPRGSLIGA